MTSSDDLDTSRLPAHIAIIMDGNGRWAAKRDLPRRAGHEAGEQALFDAVEGALDIGVSYLTVYAFSTENWKRPATEVRWLMNFNRDLLRRRADELDERGVRVRFLGRVEDRVPRQVIKMISDTEARTADNTRMTFQVAFNYGGRTELVDATRRLAAEAAAGRLSPEDLTEESIQSCLYQPDAPNVDLLIRTSGEQRLSNFLLWEAAYAEFVFTEVLWPDFGRDDLYAAIRAYQDRARRFGRV